MFAVLTKMKYDYGFPDSLHIPVAFDSCPTSVHSDALTHTHTHTNTNIGSGNVLETWSIVSEIGGSKYRHSIKMTQKPIRFHSLPSLL